MSDEMQNESTRGRLAWNGPSASKMAQKGQKMAQNGQFSKILICVWCGYSKLVPGDVWQDEK